MGQTYGLPTVPVLNRLTGAALEAGTLQQAGQRLAEAMEARNAPERGCYLEEGAVLNLEGPQTAQLWKFKPASMAEFHRLARRKLRDVTVRHELFKLWESGSEPTVAMLRAALAEVYGREAVDEAGAEIEQVYHQFGREFDLAGTVAAV